MTVEIIDQIHELILEDRRISAKSLAEQLGISHEQVWSTIHEVLDMLVACFLLVEQRTYQYPCRWRCVVKFTPQPLYTGKESLYPLNRRLVGLQRWSGCFGEERNMLGLQGLKPVSSSS
jgi:hypothetical protein